MYKIEWDSETGGVLLSSRVTKETLGIAPRPVFHEELDLIGLDRLGWTYPHCKAPIMWAVNKQYFYRGQHLFDAKGANIYDAPTLVMADGVEPMALEPMDVKGMLAKNADQMFLIESEAIEFIRDTYVTYAGANRAHDAIRANKDADYEALAAKVEAKTKTKMAVVKEDCDSFDIVPLKTAKEEGKRVLLSTRIDRFIASFSGGKDSQVVLDLCTRAIPPTEFEVIYSDTGYELPPFARTLRAGETILPTALPCPQVLHHPQPRVGAQLLGQNRHTQRHPPLVLHGDENRSALPLTQSSGHQQAGESAHLRRRQGGGIHKKERV